MANEGSPANRLRGAAAILAALTSLGTAGAAFPDNVFAIVGSSDATKKAQFEVDGFTTATTRLFTLPNANAVLAGSAAALTSGRVPYGTTGGLLIDGAGLTYATDVLAIGDGSASSELKLNGAAGQTRSVRFYTGGSLRWRWRCNTTAEGGANSGSNINFDAYDDTGTIIDAVWSITRASGGSWDITRPMTLSTASAGLTIAKTTGTTLTVSSTAAAAIACAGGATLADTLAGVKSTNGTYVGLSLANASTGTSARTDWTFNANDNTFTISAHGSTYTAIANRTGRMVFSAPSTSAGFRWETGGSASPGDFVFAPKGTTALTLAETTATFTGTLLMNAAASQNVAVSGTTIAPVIQAHGTGGNASSATIARYSGAATAGFFVMAKSRGTSVGSLTVVQDSDHLGTIVWNGSDGTAFREAALIRCEVDGTPGASDMPGRILFLTTPDGAASPVEAMRINAAGTVVVTASTTTRATLRLPHGAAPTSPVDGDMWTTTAGMFIRINGVTKTVTLT